MDKRRVLPRLGLALAAAALVALLGWFALADPAQGGSNSVRIQPASAAVGPADTVTVTLVAEAASVGLGRWEIDVKYNNALLSATACTSHPEGQCDKAFSADTIQSTGHPVEADLAGQVTLAEITFRATGPAGQCSPLRVQVVAFIDPDTDRETNPTASDGEICIQGPAEAAPTTTPTAIATASTSAASTPTPVSRVLAATQGPTADPGEALPLGGGPPGDSSSSGRWMLPLGTGLGLALLASAWMVSRRRQRR